MCTLVLFSIAAGCDGAAPGSDLSSSAAEDLSVARQDLAVSDMLRPRCLSPAPVAYLEAVTYIWSSPGGPVAQSTSFSNVAVRGDGTFLRPGDPITSPDRFTCSFTEVDIDPLTCTAPCCPSTVRQPQPLAPTVYVDQKGWSSWMGGSCAFFIGNTPYNAAATHIATQPAH